MAFNTGFPALFFSTAWAASLDDDDESDRTLRGGADSAAIAEALRRAGITTEENRPNAAARVFVTTPEDDSDLPALVTFDETDPGAQLFVLEKCLASFVETSEIPALANLMDEVLPDAIDFWLAFVDAFAGTAFLSETGVRFVQQHLDTLFCPIDEAIILLRDVNPRLYSNSEQLLLGLTAMQRLKNDLGATRYSDFANANRYYDPIFAEALFAEGVNPHDYAAHESLVVSLNNFLPWSSFAPLLRHFVAPALLYRLYTFVTEKNSNVVPLLNWIQLTQNRTVYACDAAAEAYLRISDRIGYESTTSLIANLAQAGIAGLGAIEEFADMIEWLASHDEVALGELSGREHHSREEALIASALAGSFFYYPILRRLEDLEVATDWYLTVLDAFELRPKSSAVAITPDLLEDPLDFLAGIDELNFSAFLVADLIACELGLPNSNFVYLYDAALALEGIPGLTLSQKTRALRIAVVYSSTNALELNRFASNVCKLNPTDLEALIALTESQNLIFERQSFSARTLNLQFVAVLSADKSDIRAQTVQQPPVSNLFERQYVEPQRNQPASREMPAFVGVGRQSIPQARTASAIDQQARIKATMRVEARMVAPAY